MRALDTWYIAGPMTNVPQFNIPLFDAAAAELRHQGHAVISPAELDSPQIRAEALASLDGKLIDEKIGDETWGQILARDVRIVADTCTGIVLLPGWQKSRGARLEVFVGLLTDKRFAEYVGGKIKDVSRAYIRADLQRCIP